MDTHVTGEHKLVGELEPDSCLLLTSARVHRSQIQIQPIEHRVAVGGLPFFDDLAIQLLDQQHGCTSGEHVSSRKFLSRRSSGYQRDNLLLRQRRFTGKDCLR